MPNSDEQHIIMVCWRRLFVRGYNGEKLPDVHDYESLEKATEFATDGGDCLYRFALDGGKNLMLFLDSGKAIYAYVTPPGVSMAEWWAGMVGHDVATEMLAEFGIDYKPRSTKDTARQKD